LDDRRGSFLSNMFPIHEDFVRVVMVVLSCDDVIT
jgi:hypothetical protein